MYKKATKLKLRFSSPRGELTTEQLWDLPLQSHTKTNLNDIAVEVSKSIDVTENFITGQSKDNSIAELKLAILKDIIKDKLQENKDKATKIKNAQEVSKLEEILESKEDASLTKLGKKEIKAKIAKLKS